MFRVHQTEREREREKACLGVVKLEEEARLGNRELSLKDGGDRSAELLVDIGVKATDGDKFTISGRVLGATKCHRH